MSVYAELVCSLREKGLYISAAESCTGGMFASELISVPGASDVLSSSYITYSENAKINILGVKKDTIQANTVVSEGVAVEMAKGVVSVSGADVGVGITGYAGPSQGLDENNVGKVCFGFCVKGVTVSATKQFGDIGRNEVRILSCLYAADTLMSLINKFGD